MTQSTLSVRVNSEDKKDFENFCKEVGINASVSINLFFSPANMSRLEKSVAQLRDGKGTEHDLIEMD